MKDLFRQLAARDHLPWVWLSGLLVVLALLIWFGGPALAINEYKLWASVFSRLFSISLLGVLAALILLLRQRKAHRRQLAEESDEARQERLWCASTIKQERAQMRGAFRNARRFLRGSRLFTHRDERWRAELPWYLLLGPEASGKTSLLTFSGLRFQTTDNHPQGWGDEVRRTPLCEWYFADDAVLVDTAGRFLCQGDKQVDAPAWQNLLGLLGKRRTRPLNGVLLNLSVHLLLNASAEELKTLASQVGLRLCELSQRLCINVPVYLILSKADQVPGFDEFFMPLSPDEREQVFGVSFDDDQNSHDVEVVSQEFERLLRHLDSQVIPHLGMEQDPQRYGAILDFPHQLRRLESPLCQFVKNAFATSQEPRGSQLRGFYLTSTPHWVTPNAPLKADESPPLDEDQNPAVLPAVRPRIRHGQSGFIKHLLSRVIFPESTLARLKPHAVHRLYWQQAALGAGALGCLSLFGLLWGSTFTNQRDHLAELLTQTQDLIHQHEELNAPNDIAQVLSVLDNSYAATQAFAPPAPASFLSGALARGEAVTATLQQSYEQLLWLELLPRVARHLENQLSANLHDRNQLLNTLRAYLILGNEKSPDADLLKKRLAADWSLRYPGNADVQNRLNTHFERLLAAPWRPYRLNAPLVEQARQTLRKEPLSQVVYQELVTQARSLPDYQVGRAFADRGLFFADNHYRIPGLYTQQGYQQFLLDQGAQVVQGLLRDNWVLGDSAEITPLGLQRLLNQVADLYFRDYGNHWSAAISQLRLEPIESASHGARLLGTLTAVQSPVLDLLREIRDNTQRPAPPPAPAEVAANPDAKLARIADKLDTTLAPIPALPMIGLSESGWPMLERRFADLHQLLDREGNAGPELTRALLGLEALQYQLGDLSQASEPGAAAFELAKGRMSSQGDPIHQVNRAAQRLPPPLNTWLRLMADDSWMLVLHETQNFLNQRYQDELYAVYSESLKQRYPFAAHSKSDVALADFREFFKSQGLAEQFFDSYLKPFVSSSAGAYQFRKVEGRGLPISPVILTQMEHVRSIRRSFFAENPNEPQVLFKLEPQSLSANLNRVDFQFDNQQLAYRHGPIVQKAFRWPAQSDAGRSSVLVEGVEGHRVGIEQSSGPWSLFRLLEMMSIKHDRVRDVLVLTADLEGRYASYLLHSQRSPNPFDFVLLRRFQLPERLL